VMHYQASVDVRVSKLKNVQRRMSVLCLTNCCSHQPIWQRKEGIRGAAITRSLLAAGRTWEASPAFFIKILIVLYLYNMMIKRKEVPSLKVGC